MNYEATLNIVRSISENATLRPSPNRLRLRSPGPVAGAMQAIESFEELHPPRHSGTQTTHGIKPRRPSIQSALAQVA